MSGRQIIAKRMAVVAASLVVAFLAPEAVVRFVCKPRMLVANLVPSQASDGYMFLSSDHRVRTAPRSASLRMPPARKQREYRIAAFGGSSTFGTPYGPEAAFPHFLLKVLKARWPDVDFLVFNMGFFAQTYSFALVAARDAAELKPDSYVIYSGHNELYPHNLYWTARKRGAVIWGLFEATDWLSRHSRLIALLTDVRERQLGPQRMPQDAFDWRTHVDDAVVNYQRVSGALVALAKRSGARLIYVTPLRNLRDFPPEPGDDVAPLLAPGDAERLAVSSGRTPTDSYRLGASVLAEFTAGFSPSFAGCRNSMPT